jgi:hypothetical protein
VGPDLPLAEAPHVSFADLVKLLGEGIAVAQKELDAASANLIRVLAEDEVDVVSRIEEIIAPDGTVSYERHTEKVSLLELGVMPTFYRFSEAKVEVAMDVKVMQSQTQGPQRRERGRFLQWLFGDTRSVREARDIHGRDVTTSSRLTATLVPVPMPLPIEPVRVTRNETPLSEPSLPNT